jgi:stromal membrane-associated protein
VDLDAWTDEQLQSVLKWGNSRANKYWEAKLAPGHVPSEAKIENFIRTKYESKRWVMDGPMPDPSTLDADGDDDVPLSLVKEKHNIERQTSQRASTGQPAGPSQVRRGQQPDLFGDDIDPPPRANSAAPIPARPPPKVEAAPPKQTKPADSLLGLDFFGTETVPPNRPSSAAAAPGAQSRPDLKQSILSLYSSAPRPQPQPQPSHSSQGSFGGMQSPMQHSPPPQQSAFGGMNDAFSGLSFSSQKSPTMQAPPKPSAFSGFGNVASHQKKPSQVTSPPANLSGGSFFDAKPVQQSPPQPSRTFSSSSGFGAFDSAPGISPIISNTNTSSGMADLFDFSAPSPPAAAPKQTIASPPVQHSSVFNLSQPAPAPPPKANPTVLSGWNNNDAWGSNDAWSSAKTSPPLSKPAPMQTSSGDFGWGSGGTSLANQSIVPGGGGGFSPKSHGPPKVSVDEDFGGWSSAAPVTSAAGAPRAKPASGFATSEDLFSNVWE